jgi:hypothetical protein
MMSTLTETRTNEDRRLESRRATDVAIIDELRITNAILEARCQLLRAELDRRGAA